MKPPFRSSSPAASYISFSFLYCLAMTLSDSSWLAYSITSSASASPINSPTETWCYLFALSSSFSVLWSAIISSLFYRLRASDASLDVYSLSSPSDS